MEVFIGTIQMFGFNFAPRGWALCNGQTIAISQQQALFSLLGTIYGGNGTTNFLLPNLQSRQPVGFGQGLGLSQRVLGEVAGVETVTLRGTNLPPIPSTGLTVSTTINLASTPSAAATTPTATNSYLGASPVGGPTSAAIYSDQQGTAVPLSGVTTTIGGILNSTGGSTPVGVLNPYLAVNFSIALSGIFPTRN